MNKETRKIEKAIELDGYSHNHGRQRHLDIKKDDILEQSDIEFHRINVGSDFSKQISQIVI